MNIHIIQVFSVCLPVRQCWNVYKRKPLCSDIHSLQKSIIW